MSRHIIVGGCLVLALVTGVSPAPARDATGAKRLSKIGPAPEFLLMTQDGARLALRDLRGKVVAVASITVDPERDTPDVLRRYGRTHGANPAGWAFLTGAAPEIQDVERRYGVY